MIQRYLKVTCDDCGMEQFFSTISDIRYFGWALSRGNIYTYCPKCAPWRRNVGRGVSKNDLRKR